jgi:actin related protein 2/3 complex subunit 2
MLLLEYHNKIIEDTLTEKFNSTNSNPEAVEATIADFDAVTFHLFTDQNQKNLLNISISIKCFSTLRQFGVDEVLKKQYGNLLVSPEPGYDVTLQVNTAQPPQDKESFIRNVALLKRHCFAAPFYKIFADIEAKKPGTLVEIPYRDNESIYLKPEVDRCIVIFSIGFKDTDDIVLAKTFLQEYADARRTMSNAPSVSYAQKEPPLELKGLKNLNVSDAQGYVSFVLFQPHIAAAKREKTIDNIQTFRNYLHYHLKCSKAFLHTRMRNRVRTFLQVLNRAKSEPENKEKKTITGRTFKRADDAPSQMEQEYNI